MESPTIEKMKIENLLASNHVIKFKDLLLYNTWQPSRNTKSAITKHQRSGMTPTNHRINHLFHIWLIKNWVIMRKIQFVTRIPEIQSNSAEMTKDLRKMILCRNGWHKWNNVIKSASSFLATHLLYLTSTRDSKVIKNNQTDLWDKNNAIRLWFHLSEENKKEWRGREGEVSAESLFGTKERNDWKKKKCCYQVKRV